MPRKTKIIFIIVFIIVGAVMLGIYYANKPTIDENGNVVDSGYNIFNPFKSNSPSNSNDNTSGEPINTEDLPIDQNIGTNSQASKLSKLTNFAVSGAVYFEDKRPLPEPRQAALEGGEAPKTTKVAIKVVVPKFEIVPSLRYVEKVTGHIYHMYLDTKAESKISNSTIPSIYEAIFDGSAKSVIYRYLSEDKSITSFMATLGSSKGEFLPSNITDISVSPDKTKFFYLTKTANGIVGNTRSFSDTKKAQVFTSSFSEWLPQWATNTKIFLTTKPSYSVNGSLFVLNTATSEFKKVFGGVPGLTTLVNNLGTVALYSNSTTSGPQLGLLDVDKHTTNTIGAYGLPEKCVWNSASTSVYCAIPNDIEGSQYPDSWYKGLISFSDSFVKIDPSTQVITTIIEDFNTEALDAVNLFLDKSESTLFFINKKDSTLWSLNLK